jgi:hypothetical protein
MLAMLRMIPLVCGPTDVSLVIINGLTNRTSGLIFSMEALQIWYVQSGWSAVSLGRLVHRWCLSGVLQISVVASQSSGTCMWYRRGVAVGTQPMQ